jgi:hypothetical protein
LTDASRTSCHDESALHRLCVAYAIAVDDGDAHAFAEVFEPAGRLRMYRPGDTETPSVDLVGEDALRGVPADVRSRYAMTLHLVGQTAFEVRGDDAVGTTYCLAHHLEPTAHGGVDHVMHIRYADVFRRDGNRAWRIAERTGRCLWTETRAVDAIAPRAAR